MIVCGVVGWRRKQERREKAGQNQYLEAMETLDKRTSDKLLEKTSWYKDNNKRKAENEESKYQYNPPTKKRRQGAGAGKGKKISKKEPGNNSKKIKSVMFVPYTKHSELATRLRHNEEKMETMTGYRIKIVEKGGTKLVDILTKANPWAGEDCRRGKCLLCKTKREEGKTNSQDCRKRNCVYETSCLTCTERQDAEVMEKFGEMGKKKVEEERKKIKRYIYIGETNRSMYEQGLEHQNDIPACKTSSHMLRHLLAVHEEEEETWDQNGERKINWRWPKKHPLKRESG